MNTHFLSTNCGMNHLVGYILTPGLTDINPVIRPIESRISTNRIFKRIGLLKSPNTLINSDDGYVMYDLYI